MGAPPKTSGITYTGRPPVRNDQMMHAAPMAPSAPATVAVTRPVAVEIRQAALRPEHGDGQDDTDEAVGDTHAQQRLEWIAELRLAEMQQHAVRAPGQHGAGHEDQPDHGLWPRRQ